MAHPHYGDIGKSANDLLQKDFPTGQVKLELNTTTANGVKFTVTGNQDQKTGAISSELKAKYADKPNGLTFTQSWTMANQLQSKIELDNLIAKGVKLDVTAGMVAHTGAKNGRVTLEYRQPGLHTRSHLDLFRGPVFVTDVSFGRDGLVLGSEVGYDVVDGKVTRYSTTAGFINKEYAFTMHAGNNLNTFWGSYYHRVNPDVEVAGKAVWDSKTKSQFVNIEVGTKFNLDSNASMKAKINNNGLLSLGYTQALRPGVKVTLAGIFDTGKFNENAHKLGMSLVFEN